MPRRDLRVHPCALNLAWNDPAANLAGIDAMVARKLAADPGVDPESTLMLFPELTLTGFVTTDPPMLEPDGPEIAKLAEIAARRRVALGAGWPQRNPADPAKPFNVYALFGPDGRMLGAYRKIHLFTLGKEPEAAAYSAGSRGLLLQHRGWTIAFSVCFDVRFSRLFLEYAKRRADLVLAPACWVGGPHKTYQFRTLNSAHAVLGQCYVAAVNRDGGDPNFEYDGAEYVFSPFGEQRYEGKGLALDAAELEKARALAVRPSDRDDYPVDVTNAA